MTMLGNPWVSLLRFDVGDLVQLADGPCPCGRTAGLTLASIEGRTRDLTFAVDGRAVSVGELDRAVGELDGLLAYRMEQTGRDEHAFLFVAESGAEAVVSAAAAATLHQLYGAAAHIATRRENTIVAEQSGKFRLAQTRFAREQAPLFGEGDPRPPGAGKCAS